MKIRMRTVNSIGHFKFGVMNEEKDLIAIGSQRFEMVLDECEYIGFLLAVRGLAC
jgi:hypothetical protein